MIEKRIIKLLVVALLGLIFSAIRKRNAKKSKTLDGGDFEVKQSNLYKGGVVLILLLSLALAILPNIYPDGTWESWMNYITAGIVFGATYWVFAVFSWKVQVRGNRIRIDRFLKDPVDFRFKDIDEVKVIGKSLLVVRGKNHFTVGEMMPGYDIFIEKLKGNGIIDQDKRGKLC